MKKFKVRVQSRSWALAPEDIHDARFYGLIGLGIQPPNPNFKNPRPQDMALVYVELSNTREVFDPEKGPQPFVVHAEYTRGMGKRSNMRKLMEAIHGRRLSESEALNPEYDFAANLGKPLRVQTLHETSSSGNEYDKIISVAAVPRGVNVPPLHNSLLLYDAGDGEDEVFDSLPDWIKEKIRASEEFTGEVYSSKEEIARRNMATATQNAVAEAEMMDEAEPDNDEIEMDPADPAGFIDALSDEELRDPDTPAQVRELIKDLAIGKDEKVNLLIYMEGLVRRAKKAGPPADGD